MQKKPRSQRPTKSKPHNSPARELVRKGKGKKQRKRIRTKKKKKRKEKKKKKKTKNRGLLGLFSKIYFLGYYVIIIVVLIIL